MLLTCRFRCNADRAETYRPLQFVVQEIWKNIEGFEGYYQVSNLGRVKSLKRTYYSGSHNSLKTIDERILSPYRKSSHYFSVKLRIDGICKTHFIHRLVAKTFIPNPENKPEVNHINGDKTDNRVANLEWVTRSQNIRHAFDRKIISRTSNVAVLQFTKDGTLVAEYPSIAVASKETGVNAGNIGSCCRGSKGYPHAGGFVWKYKEK